MNVDHLDTLKSATLATPNAGYAEIDLKRYAEIFFAWWREIVLFVLGTTIIAAGLGLGLRAVIPPVYETSADIILARVVSSVNLVESFRTTTEDMNQAATAGNARREALVHLVKSGAVAEAVIAELGDQLDEDERNAALLIEMVEAEAPVGTDSRTISDLVRITVSADTPEKAAAIANAWARHYVNHINSVYNQVPSETFASVEGELQQANADYVAAQQALETFIAENRIEELRTQISQKSALRTNYVEAQTSVITTIIDQDQDARLKIFNDLVSTQTEALYQVFNHQVQEQLGDLAQLYQARARTERQIALAQNLREQIQADSEGQAGTALALQLLKTQVYATVEGSSLPGGLTIELGSFLTEGNVDAQVDVDALISTLESYLSQLDVEIEALSEQLLAGEGYDYVDRYTAENLMITTAATQTMTNPADPQNQLATAIYARYLDLFAVSELAQLGWSETGEGGALEISLIIQTLTQEIQSLQATLAAEESQQLILTQQRDLMWNTYNTLSNKVVELQLARTAANTEVRLGSPAVIPLVPVPGLSLLPVTAIAGVLGFIFAIFVVVIAHLMGRRPWLSGSQPA